MKTILFYWMLTTGAIQPTEKNEGVQMDSFDANNVKIELVYKEDLLKPYYVMIDRSGADSFLFIETPTHYGINIYNCCGSNDILTPKK